MATARRTLRAVRLKRRAGQMSTTVATMSKRVATMLVTDAYVAMAAFSVYRCRLHVDLLRVASGLGSTRSPPLST
eukprot:11204817-Lingulodinium_polyedra.AAC.1